MPLIAGASLDSSKDLILLVGLGALVLVGVFATELAGETWDLVQQEMRSDADARDEELSIIDADGTRGWGGMVGPLNTSAAAAWVERSVPVGVQDEVSAAWDGMRGFSEEQWEPAMEHALRKREARLAEEAKQADAIMDGTWLESLFGVDLGGGGKEASAAVGSEKVGGGGGVFSAESSQERSRPSVATALYGEPDGDEAAAAERRRMAEWSVSLPNATASHPT